MSLRAREVTPLGQTARLHIRPGDLVRWSLLELTTKGKSVKRYPTIFRLDHVDHSNSTAMRSRPLSYVRQVTASVDDAPMLVVAVMVIDIDWYTYVLPHHGWINVDWIEGVHT